MCYLVPYFGSEKINEIKQFEFDSIAQPKQKSPRDGEILVGATAGIPLAPTRAGALHVFAPFDPHPFYAPTKKLLIWESFCWCSGWDSNP